MQCFLSEMTCQVRDCGSNLKGSKFSDPHFTLTACHALET